MTLRGKSRRKPLGMSVDFYFLSQIQTVSDLKASFFFPSTFLCLLCWLPQIVGQLYSSPDFLFLLPREGCLLAQLFQAGAGGAFPPFVCVTRHLSGFPLGTATQPGEPVSFKAVFPFSGRAGCSFWMTSGTAQAKRDGM